MPLKVGRDTWLQEVWQHHCQERHIQEMLFQDMPLQLSFDFNIDPR